MQRIIEKTVVFEKGPVGRAYEWLQENAEPDISEKDGKQYRWKFKA